MELGLLKPIFICFRVVFRDFSRTYLAVVLDQYSRRVIGWAVSNKMKAVALELAKNCKVLLIYTNDLVVAQILAGASRYLVMLGGRVSLHELATHGHETITRLQLYHTEFALIGVGGLSAEAGLTDFNFEGAALRNTMLSHAQQPLLLADHTKFGIIGQVALDQPPTNARLVVDIAPPDEILSAQAALSEQIDIA